eukprot:COSAG01_NODE_19978_length_978_cov_1.941980_1_plen_215_part_00
MPWGAGPSPPPPPKQNAHQAIQNTPPTRQKWSQRGRWMVVPPVLPEAVRPHRPQTQPTIVHARLSCFDNRSLTAAVAACAFSSAATTSGDSSAERGGGGAGAGAGGACTREASATARPSSVGTHPLAHQGPSKRLQRTCFQSIRPKQARGTRRRGPPAIFAPVAQLRRSSASFSRHRASACFTAASSAAWWSTAAASTAACMRLPRVFPSSISC